MLPDGRQIGDNDYYKVHSEEDKYLIVFLIRCLKDKQLVRLSDGIIRKK